MKKRAVSLLLVVCMMLSMCSTVLAAPSNNDGQQTKVEKQKSSNGKKVGHKKKETVETPGEPMAPVAPAEPAVPEDEPVVGEEPTEPEVPVEPTINLDNTSVVEGKPITVTTTGYPEGSELTYKWTRVSCEYTPFENPRNAVERAKVTVKKTEEQVGTEASYTPVAADREKWLRVTVSCDGYEDKTAEVYFSKLPVVYLNEFDVDYVIETKSDYVKCKIDMQSNGKFAANTLAEGKVSVKGRGNTSWASDKKPFKLKFSDKVNMLGMGKNKHWVLLADATEGTHMRNDLSYKLSGEFGLTYQDGEWVDLVINGEYYGTYYLCEHVRIGGTRVDIADLADDAEDAAAKVCKEGTGCIPTAEEDDLAGAMEEDLSWITSDSFTYTYKDEAGTEQTTTFKVSDYYEYDSKLLTTGGVLFELDAYFDEISRFKSSLGQPIMFNSPEFANTNDELVAYSKNFINSFEAAIQNPDFHGAYNGKTVSAYDLFDFDALIQYWFIEEIFMNEDGMKKSTYLHKDRDTTEGISKMNMGPVWDMDWSASGEGNTGDYKVWQTLKYKDKAQAKQWYKYLTQDPYFLTRAQEFYWEHRSQMKDMIASVRGDVAADKFHDNSYDYIYESAKENEKRWPKVYAGRVFESEVDELETFLSNRMNWLDGKMTSVEEMGFYTPDDSVQLSLDGTKVKISAPGVKAKVLVNGKAVGAVDFINGKGMVTLSSDVFTEKRDVIYVVAYNALGQAVGTNYCYDEELVKGNPLEYKMVEKPENVVYSVGDNLNLKGMRVISLYENGYSEVVPNMDLTVSGFDNQKIGTQTITVSCGTWSDSFEVFVGNEITEWKNDYVTLGSDKTLSGSKSLKIEIWESGTGAPRYEKSGVVSYDGNFSDINFSAVAADGWKVLLVKYEDGDYHSGPVHVGGKSGTFHFEGVENANTLIIDIVKEDNNAVETTLEESFTATDCGTITTDAKGTENSVGFMVYKGEERVFTSAKPFTYDGDFNALTFNYTAPEGFEVASVEGANANNERVKGDYADGKISFTDDNDAEYIIINLKEATKTPFTLTCNKTTVRIRTNAIVYLKSEDVITAADIKVFEKDKQITTFKTPVWDEATGSWKVYLMPTTLGKHTYTISVGGFSQDIEITGSK